MGTNVRDFIIILLAIARRRWFLIALPILLFIGLSVLAATFWPRTYIARTLIMLQEGQASDPLNYGGRALRRTQLRGAALDTLLKSRLVLEGAVRDFYLNDKPLTAKQADDEIKSLRKQIFVGVVGQEFIEIELRQSRADGIEDRLSIIMTRFLERLFAGKDPMKTARQYTFGRRKLDLEFAERALVDWFASHPELAAQKSIKESLERTTELQGLRSQAETKLKTAASSIIEGASELTNIVAHLAQARQFTNGLETGKRPDGLRELGELLENYEAISKGLVEALRASVAATEQHLKSSDQAFGAVHRDLLRLFAGYTEAVEQYNVHRAQANKSKAPSLSPFGLINPELIRIIDEPQKPVSPSTSILKIIIACLGAGIGLGVGLAALAEQVDDTLYDAGELDRLSGINLVIELPKIDVHSMELDKPPEAVPI